MTKFQAVLVDRHEKACRDGSTMRLTFELTELEAPKAKTIPLKDTNLYVSVELGEVNDSTVD